MCAGICKQLSQSKEEQCHSTGSQKCNPIQRNVKPLREAHAYGIGSRSHLLHFWLLHRTHFLSQWRRGLYRKLGFSPNSISLPTALCPHGARPSDGHKGLAPRSVRPRREEVTEPREVCKPHQAVLASAKERGRLTLKASGCTDHTNRTGRKSKKINPSKLHLIWKLLISETITTDLLNTICIESFLRAKPHFKGLHLKRALSN